MKSDHAKRHRGEHHLIRRHHNAVARIVEDLLRDHITASSYVVRGKLDLKPDRRLPFDAHDDKNGNGARRVGQREWDHLCNAIVEHVKRHDLRTARRNDRHGTVGAVIKLDA
jgi:hypothetical protein